MALNLKWFFPLHSDFDVKKIRDLDYLKYILQSSQGNRVLMQFVVRKEFDPVKCQAIANDTNKMVVTILHEYNGNPIYSDYRKKLTTGITSLMMRFSAAGIQWQKVSVFLNRIEIGEILSDVSHRIAAEGIKYLFPVREDHTQIAQVKDIYSAISQLGKLSSTYFMSKLFPSLFEARSIADANLMSYLDWIKKEKDEISEIKRSKSESGSQGSYEPKIELPEDRLVAKDETWKLPPEDYFLSPIVPDENDYGLGFCDGMMCAMVILGGVTCLVSFLVLKFHRSSSVRPTSSLREQRKRALTNILIDCDEGCSYTDLL